VTARDRDAPARPFEGFGPDTLAFLTELHDHNEKAWFDANRDRYERWVRGPMQALVGELEGLFGPGRLFRPNRDVRFSKDKRPYKESVAATVGGRTAVAARYLHLNTEHLFVAAGAHQLQGDALRAYRRAVDHETSGSELVRIEQQLAAKGYALGGRTLKRGPRDVDPEHPRLELLKHTGVTIQRAHPVGDWLYDPSEVVPRVIETFADAEPLVAWAREHLS
jgi:uncharacterized protein (TIGR02453 family)